MNRRAFMTLLGGAAAWPPAARAQPAMPVVGWLGDTSEAEDFRVVPFRQGLKESGYVEGNNLTIEYRWAGGQYDRLAALAADLVHRQVAVIAAPGNAAAISAKTATATIPIVFQMARDPVQLGVVASLSRPGGNMTGLISLNIEVGPKNLELLHELVPKAGLIGLLVNPNNPDGPIQERVTQAAANSLGLKLHVVHAGTEHDFDAAFASLIELRAGALVIPPNSFFFIRSGELGALALRHAIPAICPYREFAAAGGLMSYGTNILDQYRQLGVYTSRILKGEKAAELPVQQAVKLELVINLKTAKALGLEVPMSMLMRVDEVIE